MPGRSGSKVWAAFSKWTDISLHASSLFDSPDADAFTMGVTAATRFSDRFLTCGSQPGPIRRVGAVQNGRQTQASANPSGA
jgi:hypothetical protein